MLKFALIGAGRIAVNHIASVMKHEDKLTLAAVCDLVPENMDAVLAKAGFAGVSTIKPCPMQ